MVSMHDSQTGDFPEFFMKNRIEAATGAPRGGGGRHRNKPTNFLEIRVDWFFHGE